jgi:hypothetical protein
MLNSDISQALVRLKMGSADAKHDRERAERIMRRVAGRMLNRDIISQALARLKMGSADAKHDSERAERFMRRVAGSVLRRS